MFNLLKVKSLFSGFQNKIEIIDKMLKNLKIFKKTLDKALYIYYTMWVQNKFALIAQSVEHSAVNRSVTGSSPVWGANKVVKFVPSKFYYFLLLLSSFQWYYIIFATKF